jgi:hypothetical protein
LDRLTHPFVQAPVGDQPILRLIDAAQPVSWIGLKNRYRFFAKGMSALIFGASQSATVVL